MAPFDCFAFVDVSYVDDFAGVACVITSATKPWPALKSYTAVLENICRYEPGNFYKRELPCILDVFKKIEEHVSTIFVDAYVWLPDGRPGLGARLYYALDKRIAVAGIAKNSFTAANESGVVKRIFRGSSRRPLFISSAGIRLEEAAKTVSRLPGPFRIPLPMQAAHSLSRRILTCERPIKRGLYGHKG